MSKQLIYEENRRNKDSALCRASMICAPCMGLILLLPTIGGTKGGAQPIKMVPIVENKQG